MLIPPIWNHYANHHHLSQPYLRQCLIQIDRGHGRRGKRKKWAGGRHRYFTFNGTHFFNSLRGLKKRFRIFISISAVILATIIWWSCFAIMRRPVVLVRSGWNCLIYANTIARKFCRRWWTGDVKISAHLWWPGAAIFPYFCRSHRKSELFWDSFRR